MIPNPCVQLEWATPQLDERLAHIARVSNPDAPRGERVESLLRYMLREGHVSPFDMGNICVEVIGPRDIARQALRHSGLKPQEFSQRYANVQILGEWIPREFRLQDVKNRQASIELPEDDPRHAHWLQYQRRIMALVGEAYQWCLDAGGAKECARTVLPEGLTPSRLFFNGTVRSWLFYLRARLHASTQKEHRVIAQQILEIMREVAPVTFGAFFPVDELAEAA